MRKKCIVLFFCVLLVSTTACTASTITFSDQYVYGQDQHYMLSGIESMFTVAPEGTYFFGGPYSAFLYYRDKKTGQTVPLCNKPQCLHDREPDGSKIAFCNAFIDMSIARRNLTYYQGKLYFLTGSSNGYTLMQSSLDGTDRTAQHGFSSNYVSSMAIHRGFLYYTSSDYGTIAGKEDTTKTKYKLYRIPMQNLSQEPELILEGEQIHGHLGSLLCYGNYVYFAEIYNTDASLENYSTIMYRYDIQQKELLKLFDGVHNSYAIYNDRLAFMWEDGTYLYDLDGKNKRKLSDARGELASNGDFLVIDTYIDLPVVRDEKERELCILDQDGTTVNRIPYPKNSGFPIGCDGNDYYLNSVGGESNEFDSIFRIWKIDLTKASDSELRPEVYFELIPTFSYNGVTTTS